MRALSMRRLIAPTLFASLSARPPMVNWKA
jgi:hypothetical protein